MKSLNQFSFLILFAWNVQAQSKVPTKVEWKIESSKSVSNTEAVVILSAQIPEDYYILVKDYGGHMNSLEIKILEQDSVFVEFAGLTMLKGEIKNIEQLEKIYESKLATISGNAKCKAVFKLKKPLPQKRISVFLSYWFLSLDLFGPTAFEFEVKFR